MIKHLLMSYIIIACCFSAIVLAAKPDYTVEVYVNGAIVGKDIKWQGTGAQANLYQLTAHEYFNDHLFLFAKGDHVRFFIEFPESGAQSFSLYSCVSENLFIDLIKESPECPND